ncbi:MAG: hypothetical protein MI757_08805 [Pirellulales bacterium]|nr:hypothetical protein [Pirellulales bacterium]
MSDAAAGLPLRVIKLGGSLLALGDLGDRLATWRGQQAAARDILVVGGGADVERLRDSQEALGLSDESAHWKAIALMSENSRSVAERLPGVSATDDLAVAITTATSKGLCVLDAACLLAEVPSTLLPRNWDVTSDSIAAFVAQRIQANELVLLKSSLPLPHQSTLRSLAASGFVDAFFENLALAIPHVTCVNLRSRHLESVSIEAPRHAHSA